MNMQKPFKSKLFRGLGATVNTARLASAAWHYVAGRYCAGLVAAALPPGQTEKRAARKPVWTMAQRYRHPSEGASKQLIPASAAAEKRRSSLRQRCADRDSPVGVVLLRLDARNTLQAARLDGAVKQQQRVSRAPTASGASLQHGRLCLQRAAESCRELQAEARLLSFSRLPL